MVSDAAARDGPAPVKLSLFVTGATARSRSAIGNLRQFCDRHLAGRYELEIVDLYRDPGRAREAQVVATPTLIRHVPEPRQVAIGDLSDTRILLSLLMVI